MKVSVQLFSMAILSAVWLGGINVATSQNVFDFTNAGGDSLWNNPANWTGGPAGTFPNGADDTARFIGLAGANVVLNIPVTAHVEAVNSQVSISGTGSLTLPPASAPQVVLEVAVPGVDVGILFIGVPVEFTGDTTFRVNAPDPTFSGLGLTFLADVASNSHGLTMVAKDSIFGEGTNVSFQGNYNTGDIYVDGPAVVQVSQTLHADTITITSGGGMNMAAADAEVVANQLTLIGGSFSRGLATAPLANVTGPVESQGGLISGGSLAVPGLHVQKGYTFIGTFGAGQQMQLGDVTRDPGGTMNLFIGGGTSVVANSVEDEGPGGVFPWITETGLGPNFVKKNVDGTLSPLTVSEYVENPNNSMATLPTRINGIPTLTGDIEAFVVKVESNSQLNGANNTVATNAWLAGTNSRVNDITIMPLDSDELLFLAPNGGQHLTFNNVNVADTLAGPTKKIFSGPGQFTINNAWSATGDTCLLGPVKLNLGPNSDLGGTMLTIIPDTDVFSASNVNLNNAELDKLVEVESGPIPVMFSITGTAAMPGDMTFVVKSANERGAIFNVAAGGSLTHSGTITRSGAGNPIAGQGQAVVRVSGEGTMNFAATFDSTDAGVTTVLAGSNGQNVVVDGALGTTIVEEGANVKVSGGGTIGNWTDREIVAAPAVLDVAPSASIGTLAVQGDMLVRTSTFTYEAEVTDTGQSDRLAVGGTLDLSTPTDTLDISFFAGTTLADANYTLATYGSLVGIFDSVMFAGAPVADPTAPGAFGGTHQLIYGASALLLATGPVAGVAGDYNQNGIVDAADYTTWRDRLGQNVALPNTDPNDTDGLVTQAEYLFWKSRFGATAGSGALSGASVPEPASGWLLILVALTLFDRNWLAFAVGRGYNRPTRGQDSFR